MSSLQKKTDYASLDDQELLLRLHASDERAFRQLFDRYYKSVFLSGLRLTKEQNLAKDAAQEVFLELWRNRERISIKQSLLAYLKRGVINRSLNILKSRKLHMGQGDTAQLLVASKLSSPDRQAETNELQGFIHQIIDELPARCREIFILKRHEGLSHKEIANQLDISPKTVENQMTKALKILREKLRPHLSGTMIILLYLLIFEFGIGVFML